MTNRILIVAMLALGSGTLGFAQGDQEATEKAAQADKRKETDAEKAKEADAARQRLMAEDRASEAVVVHLKYASPRTVRSLLAAADVFSTEDETLRVLVISGSQARVNRALKLIQEIDVPGAAGASVAPTPVPVRKDLEFTIYLVAGLDKGATEVPKVLDDTVSQLRTLFPFTTYRLLDAAVERVSEDGRSEVHGFLQPDGATTETTEYSINVVMRGITPAARESQISVREFHCGMTFTDPANHFHNTLDVKTELDLKEGQQVVVGKASAGIGRTMFVIVSARVLP